MRPILGHSPTHAKMADDITGHEKKKKAYVGILTRIMKTCASEMGI